MKLNISNIQGDIKEYCIACLNKSANMLYLNENIEKQTLFTTVFNIELSKFAECPQFLCSVCDIKLDVTYNFQQNVKNCLTLLEEYNLQDSKHIPEDDPKLELQEAEEEILEITMEEDYSKTKVVQKTKFSKTEPVPLDLVNKVIEDFKNKFAENKTCVICGFIAANRRAISSHMALFHKEKKSRWCLECNDVFDDYNEHKKTHSTRYQCPFCEQETNPGHYVEHLQSHAGIFECDTCHKNFKSGSWLEKHKRIHTNEKPYVCPNCSKSFIQVSSLRYHIGTHGKFSCDRCKKRFKTEQDLEEHKCTTEIWIKIDNKIENNGEHDISIMERIVDSTALQNFCKDCNRRVKSLSQHVNKWHTVKQVEESFDTLVEELKCEFCEKKYSNPYKMKAHVRTHTGELPYKCKYCDKRALNRSRLKDHERTHTKEKPYICSVCGKGLSQSSALRTHMKQHTGRPEVCELCNKRFCRKSELRLHLSKHMGEKPFLCTECGRTFAQKSHLTEHMAGHSEARPFQCEHCEKAFKKSILLKEHIKLHQGNKPFKCPTCPYACYKPYRLQQHMKQHSADPSVNMESLEDILEGS